MATSTATRSGRGLFRLAIALALAGPLIYAWRFGLQRIFETPWYAAWLCGAAFLLALFALLRARSGWRVVGTVLIGLEAAAVTGMIGLAALAPYTGPARVGDALPAFEAKLAADGSAWSAADLEEGLSLLVFYRGHL